MSVPKYINKGGYGKIMESTDEKGRKFALKIVKPGKINFTEIDILTRIKSPYLLRSLDPVIEKSYNHEGIKMELKEDNLKNLNITLLPIGQIKRIFMSLLYGLECLHQSGFLHLDIKPSNCLYQKKNNIYTAYLSDFGFSIRCSNPEKGIIKKNMIGTIKYIDYSVLNTNPDYIFNIKSDIWSLGVTFLSLLGFKLNEDDIKISNKKNQEFMKYFWNKTNINKLTEDLLENLSISELDKLDIYEMITQMLKKDYKERISSKDFKNLRFYQKNLMDNFCNVSKPSEILYIPYSSPYIVTGIESLRKYFKNKFPDSKKEVYFLAVEIFIRIMAKSYYLIEKEELEKNIQISFITAMKYYGNIKLNINQYFDINNKPYDIIKILKGEIAPNTLYYDSKYIEDLILLDKIILNNYNLISFYMFLKPKNLFKYFRSTYEYEKINKDFITTIGEFLDLKVPEKNIDNKIENIRDIYSYQDFKNKNIENDYIGSELNIYRKSEEILREKINSIFEKMKNLNKYKLVIEKITNTEDIYTIYNKIYGEKKEYIFYPFLNYPNIWNFFITKEDMFGKLSFIGNKDSKFSVFISNNEEISLLSLNSTKDKIIHYYSNHNENLYKYYKEKNIEYSNNYKIKNPGICKVLELCIMFIIFVYNNFSVKDSYNFFSITDKTIKQLLIFSYISNDLENPTMLTF